LIEFQFEIVCRSTYEYIQIQKSNVPVKTIDHLEMTAEILLSKMFQHTRIDQTLHERTAILR